MGLSHFAARHFGAQSLLTLGHNYAVVTSIAPILSVIVDDGSVYQDVLYAQLASIKEIISKVEIPSDVTVIKVLFDGSIINLAPGTAAIVVDQNGNLNPINIVLPSNVITPSFRATLAKAFGRATIIPIQSRSTIIKV